MQHDYDINSSDAISGLQFRQDVNNVLSAIKSSNSGATAPTTYIAGTLWLDTSTTPHILKKRNTANTGWDTIRIEDALGTAIPSATTTTVGTYSGGNTVHITGVTTITSLGVSTTGTTRTLIFDGALTITHNATSLICPNGINITTVSGDSITVICEDGALGYWRVSSISRLLPDELALIINSATAKTTPVDADLFGIVDSVASNVLKKLSWLNLKATLKTYFDTLYSVIGSGGSRIQPITASVAANALTVTLNATSLDFRSSTLGSGTVNTRTIASPISMTVSSGSTLGTVSAIASRLVLIAIDNAGTVELAIVNLSGGNNLDETTLISTASEGGAGAADSASVIYSTTARTNVPFRVVGFIDITETTAGTWATAPSTIQGIGGQALASMSSLGYGQTWQSVTRVSGTTYTNSTGKPITIMLNCTQIAGGIVSISVDGLTVGSMQQGGTTGNETITAIIPNGITYIITAVTNTYLAFELR